MFTVGRFISGLCITGKVLVFSVHGWKNIFWFVYYGEGQCSQLGDLILVCVLRGRFSVNGWKIEFWFVYYGVGQCSRLEE